jgi:glycosyltransferase involved in cell wall biosynthesis
MISPGINFYDQHLKNRTVIESNSENINLELTVFIGLFNGAKYLSDIKKSLICQINQEFYIVVVDNNSTDGTWETIQEWKDVFKGRITLVKNKQNIGGTANLFYALDLIKTSWFVQFHQDDIYLQEHIKFILKGISTAHQNIIGISTEMGSISSDGTPLLLKNRSSWLTSDLTGPEMFIANLFVHSIYWPCTAFRTNVFKGIKIPWHSAAFPDTEIILRMCAYGEFLSMPKVTMLYRENPNSMSHHLSLMESKIGTALSLMRVFASSEFIEIIRMCDDRKLTDFLTKLEDGIMFRLQDYELARVVYLYAIENANFALDYTSLPIVRVIAEKYKELNASQTIDILQNIIGKDDFLLVTNLSNSPIKNAENTLLHKNNNLTAIVMTLVKIISIDSHLKFRKRLLKIIIRLKPSHPWNFRLRK